MALQKTTSYKGIAITNAYYKISGLSVRPKVAGITKVIFSVQLKKNSESPVINTKQSNDYIFTYDLAFDSNVLIQAYNHLKTLAEFSGATTV